MHSPLEREHDIVGVAFSKCAYARAQIRAVLSSSSVNTWACKVP